MQLTLDCKTAKDLPKGESVPAANPHGQPTDKRLRACDTLVPLDETEFRNFCATHGISETAFIF